MEKSVIAEILTKAVNAPSGENCQPWKFIIDISNALSIYNIPERDQSLYNVDQNGSLIAHGALIENIALIANERGYRCEIEIPENRDPSTPTAVIRFASDSSLTPDDLTNYIDRRTTNRKTYKSVSITNDQINQLASVSVGTVVSFITDKEKIGGLSRAMSMNEKIVFEHQKIHHFFFSHIRWTEAEQNQERNGFYLPTLELDSKQTSGMKLFKNWHIVKWLNLLGVSNMIAKDNQEKYRSSSLFGAIIINDLSKSSLINAGRAFQRIWLTVTKLGLSLQPATGIVLLRAAIKSGSRDEFSLTQQNLIEESYLEFENVFEVRDGSIAVMFRVGDGGEPSAYSSKMPPMITFE